MQTVVKKWFRDKEFGFLDNGSGPDIFVRKAELSKCQFLKPGVTVEFECYADKRGLIAKNVRIARQSEQHNSREEKPFRFGVMR